MSNTVLLYGSGALIVVSLAGLAYMFWMEHVVHLKQAEALKPIFPSMRTFEIKQGIGSLPQKFVKTSLATLRSEPGFRSITARKQLLDECRMQRERLLVAKVDAFEHGKAFEQSNIEHAIELIDLICDQVAFLILIATVPQDDAVVDYPAPYVH